MPRYFEGRTARQRRHDDDDAAQPPPPHLEWSVCGRTGDHLGTVLRDSDGNRVLKARVGTRAGVCRSKLRLPYDGGVSVVTHEDELSGRISCERRYSQANAEGWPFTLEETEENVKREKRRRRIAARRLAAERRARRKGA